MTIALVLVSAFLHAAWNALLKRERDKDRALVAAVGLGAVLATVVAFARALHADAAPLTGGAVAWALVAGGCEQLYFLGLSRALERGPLAPVYTISRGGAVVAVYPLSVALFHEGVTRTSIAGSAAVLAGLVLSGVRGRGAGGAGAPGAAPTGASMTRAATLYAVACAAAIAAYHLAYKAALDAGGAPSAVFAVSLTFASAINLGRVGGTGRSAVRALLRAHPARLALMGLLCGGSFLLLIEALSQGGAGYALTLRNTSVLFALGLAWAIGEKPKLWPAIGAGLVAAGAIAMAW